MFPIYCTRNGVTAAKKSSKTIFASYYFIITPPKTVALS